MERSKRRDHFQVKGFLSGLRTMVAALPTASEKEEMRASLGTIVEFLTKLRGQVETIPSTDEIQDVNRAIEQLEGLLATAKANPVVAPALGLSGPSSGRRRAPVISDEDRDRARAALADLEQLPIDEIRLKMRSAGYSTSDLRAMALVIGLRPNQKLSRDALTHQITMKIANYRGYQRLGQTVLER